MSFFQYLKDTRGELRHVAWPTQLQTIVYTVIVILLSFLIALYLGLFDYIFTTGLKNVLQILPAQSAPAVTISNVQLSTTTPVSVPSESSPATQ
ncbi:MAG: preprotein translocase subunit SecE [bacterium]|nr:preprotein translocase subunit SecE [bacterium]